MSAISAETKGQTCVLAYSGGLDTSVAVAWLRETHGFEVVTCTGDLGTVKDLAGIQEKALASGALPAANQTVRFWGRASAGRPSAAAPCADATANQDFNMRLPPSRLPRLLPLDEVAQTLHVSIKTVRRWIQQGALHAHQFGRQLRITEEDLAAFINRARS